MRYFEWLIGAGSAATPEPLSSIEQRLLAGLDAVLASEALCAELLPRARAIVPQLLHSLRDETQSLRDLSARVARDPNLVVEVLRMANNIGYRAPDDDPVGDLQQAVARLGTEGLRRAIARVLLKPIFNDRNSPLLGRAAERLWQHSEIKADFCLRLAPDLGLDTAEAYLSGLMHNIGWTASLRALDRNPADLEPDSDPGRNPACAAQHGRSVLPVAFSAAFVRALAQRRDRFFASLVRSWELNPALNRLADQIAAVGFEHADSALAQLLRRADRLASAQVVGRVVGN